jgi:transposase
MRSLSADERAEIQAGLLSSNAFTRRRCQILQAAAEGARARAIGKTLGYSTGTARNAVKAFNAHGLACLRAKSSRPHTAVPFLHEGHAEPLRQLLRTSPRALGEPVELWTLDRLAVVWFAWGRTPRLFSAETFRLALKRLGIPWRQARFWSAPHLRPYARMKELRERLTHLLKRGRSHLDERESKCSETEA